MLTNNQMIEGRYLRWHKARRKVNAIIKHLNEGHEVYISTYTKAWKLDRRHISMIKATKTGAYMQHGKRWDNFDGCKITVYA